MSSEPRPVALVTGVGRQAGIGASIAERLLRDGFDVAVTSWALYDDRMPWGGDSAIGDWLQSVADSSDSRVVAISADLEDSASITPLFDEVTARLGAPQVLVLCHCESVDSDLFSTTIESFDRHVSVNARASWLLIREFGLRYNAPFGSGRVIALTSDATVGNLAYGASKGALDRIVIAAAREFAHLGITANVINPGPTDNGWMSDELKKQIQGQTPLGRLGQPRDAANLVSFLCSSEGAWINGQLLHSDGGVQTG